MVPQETEIAAGNRTDYTLSRDFCRIFAEDMDSLYTLCLLLTADPDKAERCFGLALEDCLGATRVFKDWARSWARRAVIRSAVQIMHPSPESRFWPGPRQENGLGTLPKTGVPLAAILQLKTFERFVFVMSVLERCSDHDGTVLLACSRADYVHTRSGALARVASFVEKASAPAALGAAAFLQQGNMAARVA